MDWFDWIACSVTACLILLFVIRAAYFEGRHAALIETIQCCPHCHHRLPYDYQGFYQEWTGDVVYYIECEGCGAQAEFVEKRSHEYQKRKDRRECEVYPPARLAEPVEASNAGQNTEVDDGS